MRKKKVLLHGTPDSLQKFFADAVSRDFEIAAILSDEPEKISVKLDVLKPQSLSKFVYNLVDGIIFTGDKAAADYFIKQGVAPRKIILYDAAQGWQVFGGQDNDGTRVAFVCGLEFHIRNDDDVKDFNLIFRWLQNQRQVKNTPPQYYPAVLSQKFRQRTGRPLDFNHLTTFTEKLQWLKIFDATPIKSRLADKYAVRRWVADKIGEKYLIPLLGVWDDFDDIDFDELPDQFVLKCNHGCGMNIIVRDKKTFDKRNAREKINAWLAVDYSCAWNTFEMHYTRIKRKIIAEQFMSNGDAPDIDNYKFWCFKGTPVFCGYDGGRTPDGNTDDLRIDYFDMNWKPTTFENASHPRSDHPENIRKPKNFKLMKKLAATLAEGFAFVRVDFYEIDGRVYFGEMTFTPGAGNFSYKPETADEYLGGLLTLPKLTPPPAALNERRRKNLSPAVRGGFLLQKKNHDRSRG